MTQHAAKPTAIDCIFENILGFMLPFFLVSARGDADLARAAIAELAEAYKAATATELEFVGRILGFNIVAMDNLRLSMNTGMSDTKVLRYRSNAVALSRAAEQCRKILDAVQANRPPAQQPIATPRPAIAAAPPPVRVAQPLSAKQPLSAPLDDPFPISIEAMKRDARVMLGSFIQPGNQSSRPMAALPLIPDAATAVDAAARAAIAAAMRK